MTDKFSDKVRALFKSGRMTYLLLAAAVLAAGLLIFWPSEKEQPAVQAAADTGETVTAEAYCAALSEEVSQMVSAITGEAAPHVTVTLRSMGETVYATEDKAREKSTQEYDGDAIGKTQTDGDSERTYILVKSADGGQAPLVLSKTEPEVRGVVIVSAYGNDAVMREKIVGAVKTALDLSSTQVCVTGRP